jgi:hypothetical protein
MVKPLVLFLERRIANRRPMRVGRNDKGMSFFFQAFELFLVRRCAVPAFEFFNPSGRLLPVVVRKAFEE